MNLPINKTILNELCEAHGVEKLYLFGSATNANFNSESDVDILVKFNQIELANYFTNYLSLKEKLKLTFVSF